MANAFAFLGYGSLYTEFHENSFDSVTLLSELSEALLCVSFDSSSSALALVVPV